MSRTIANKNKNQPESPLLQSSTNSTDIKLNSTAIYLKHSIDKTPPVPYVQIGEENFDDSTEHYTTTENIISEHPVRVRNHRYRSDSFVSSIISNGRNTDRNRHCCVIALIVAFAIVAIGTTALIVHVNVNYHDHCPPFENNLTQHRIRIIVIRGGVASFSCLPGFHIHGDFEATCLSNGEWSSDVPECNAGDCHKPEVPLHGFVVSAENPPYKIGDVAEFECDQGFMMEGKPLVRCTEGGKWIGNSQVKCVTACTYPGTNIGSTISHVKFYYAINEKVTFGCTDVNTRLQGPQMIQCLENGTWSDVIPYCKRV